MLIQPPPILVFHSIPEYNVQRNYPGFIEGSAIKQLSTDRGAYRVSSSVMENKHSRHGPISQQRHHLLDYVSRLFPLCRVPRRAALLHMSRHVQLVFFKHAHALLRHIEMQGKLFPLSLELRQRSQHIFQVVHANIGASVQYVSCHSRKDRDIPSSPGETGVFLNKLAKVPHQRIDRIFHMEVSDRDPDRIFFRQFSRLGLFPSNSVRVCISEVVSAIKRHARRQLTCNECRL